MTRIKEFHIGNIVRIREWEDMKNEFGIGYEGVDVDGKVVFVPQMKSLCGKVFTVTQDILRDNTSLIVGCEPYALGTWTISPNMVELVPKDSRKAKEKKVRLSKKDYAIKVAQEKLNNDFIQLAITNFKEKHGITSSQPFIVRVNDEDIKVFFNKKQRSSLMNVDGTKATASLTLGILNGDIKLIKVIGK